MSTQHETTSAYDSSASAADANTLVIDTFDHWVDSNGLALYPSNICWCRIDNGGQAEPAS